MFGLAYHCAGQSHIDSWPIKGQKPFEETVYTQQPPGMAVEGKENWVCKLNRSLYGLKQSPRKWNAMLDRNLKEMDFKQSIKDSCLYIKEKPLTYITISVDDLIIAGESGAAIRVVKEELKDRFCRTNQMVADIFMKPLSRNQFEVLREALGVHRVTHRVT